MPNEQRKAPHETRQDQIRRQDRDQDAQRKSKEKPVPKKGRRE